MNHESVHRLQSGLTLTELLVTLAIIALVAGIGTPPMAQWLARHRIQNTLIDLGRDMAHARRIAEYRGTAMVLCATTDHNVCAAGPTWSSGWLVFVNSDNDSPAQRDADEPTVLQRTLDGNIQLVSNRTRFVFQPHGKRSTNGTITACDTSDRTAPRRLIVSYTGRARLSQDTAGSC